MARKNDQYKYKRVRRMKDVQKHLKKGWELVDSAGRENWFWGSDYQALLRRSTVATKRVPRGTAVHPVAAAPRTKPVRSDSGATYIPEAIDPIKAKGLQGSVTFDGATITVKSTMKRANPIPLEILKTMVMENTTLWFGVVGARPPKGSWAQAGDPNTVSFTPKYRSEFSRLVAAIEAHRAPSA